MIRFLIILLIFTVMHCTMAQVINLRGQITDKADGEGVPYVNIRLQGYYYGTSTNLEGRFELKLNPDHFQGLLTISCIGYQSKVIDLSQIDSERYQHIVLERVTTQLDEVVVKSKRAQRRENIQAKTVVMDALDLIPRHRPHHYFGAKTFYRHYCQEDSTYVRLIEAALDIGQHKKDKSFVQIPEHKLGFKVTQLRRSFDFTQSAKLEHPHISLNFLLSNDLTSYEFHNPLRRNLDNYQFSFADTTQLDGKPIVVIDFESLKPTAQHLSYEGSLYIGLKDLAFVKADIRERAVQRSLVDSVNSVVRKQIFFERIGKAMYPNRVISDVDAWHYQLDTNQNRIVDKVRHQSHVELMTNAVTPRVKEPLKGKEPSEQAMKEIEYEPDFWQDYTVLEATPLEEKIIKDLSAKMELDKQFEVFNRIEEGAESIIKTDEFQELLGLYEGTPVYVLFWAGWGLPNFYELETSPEFRKLVRKERFKFLLVSLDDNDKDWEQNRDFNGLNQNNIIHHRLDFDFDSEMTRVFFKNMLPQFVIFDRYGEVYDLNPPLPNAEGKKDYFLKVLELKKTQSTANR